MNTIKISSKIELNLNFETQIAPSGRPIRLSGTAKNVEKGEKWINKMFRSCWIYTFRYLDTPCEFVSFEFDYNDCFIGKV
jgi:hypothetical protein